MAAIVAVLQADNECNRCDATIDELCASLTEKYAVEDEHKQQQLDRQQQSRLRRATAQLDTASISSTSTTQSALAIAAAAAAAEAASDALHSTAALGIAQQVLQQLLEPPVLRRMYACFSGDCIRTKELPVLALRSDAIQYTAYAL
jgi:exonuclease VII large subunit